jgi:phosphohistidine phosphatase
MLYLVQHGQAATEEEDPERPLTTKGTNDVTRVARLATEHLGARPVHIVHSGKSRARQTAEIWAEITGASVDQADALAPNDDPAVWADRLRDEAEDVMIVGHLPHVARLASMLLVGDADRSVVGFQPGGLVALERDGATWSVTALVPPAAT